MKESVVKQFKEGIITNNPTFVQLLGMCPTLATTTAVVNALGMGAAVTVVLIFSNLFISLVRNLIPRQIRIASYIVIISGFVTAVELLIKAFFPVIDKALGLFIPLIVVNCIILARAESFASKNKPLPSVIDGAATGIGFTLALFCIAFVRELLGTGKVFAAADGTGGIALFGSRYPGASFFLLPAGAFLTLGCLIALVHKLTAVAEERAAKREATSGRDGVEADGQTELHEENRPSDLNVKSVSESALSGKYVGSGNGFPADDGENVRLVFSDDPSEDRELEN